MIPQSGPPRTGPAETYVSPGKTIDLDIVVAVRNEQQNIPLFLRELERLSLSPLVRYRVIMVEDGSTDGTLDALAREARERTNFAFYSLDNSRGQAGALAFGLHHSNGNALVLMDVDGEHPIHLIPRMVDAYLAGYQIVQCVREASADQRKLVRAWGSVIFNRMFRMLVGIDLSHQNVYFRLISAEVRRELIASNRWLYFHRLPPRFFSHFKTVTLFYRAPRRQHGHSKYPAMRLVRFATEGILAMITVRRLGLGTILVCLGCLLLVHRGDFVLAAGIGVGLAFLWYRFLTLCLVPVTSGIRVVHSSWRIES